MAIVRLGPVGGRGWPPVGRWSRRAVRFAMVHGGKPKKPHPVPDRLTIPERSSIDAPAQRPAPCRVPIRTATTPRPTNARAERVSASPDSSCRATTTLDQPALRMRIACIHDGEPLYGATRLKLNLIPMPSVAQARDRPSALFPSGFRTRLRETVDRAEPSVPAPVVVPDRFRARSGRPAGRSDITVATPGPGDGSAHPHSVKAPWICAAAFC